MKIAFVISTFPPYRGGVGNVAFYQARELARLGNEVTVLTPLYDKSQRRAEEVDGIKAKRLAPIFKYGNAAWVPQVFGLLKNFDIIYLHYPCFGIAEVCWLFKLFNPKKKFVIFYHMDVVGRGVLGLIFKIYTKIFTPLIIKSADGVIGSSLDYLRHSDVRTSIDERFCELPFGVDFSSNFLKSNSNTSNKFKKVGKKVVLFVGGLDKAHYFKGIDVLIEAMDITKCQMLNVKCQIVGDGNRRPYYESLVKKRGLEDYVKFTGEVSNEKLVEYYKKADVLVLPSVDKSEAFGLVLIEAMAWGTPVIASNLPGVRSVVEEGITGFLVEPKNVGQLANRIEYILSHLEEAGEMGENGRKKVEERYDWKKIGRQLEKILRGH